MVVVVIYASAVTCGRSFTVLSVWGVLISFWSVLVFSPTLLSLYYYYYYLIVIIVCVVVTIIIGYYCYYLSPQSSWLCVTGAWAGAGYDGRGSWLGCG